MQIRFFTVITLMVLSCVTSFGQSPMEIVLSKNWSIQQREKVTSTPEVISTTGFSTIGWHSTNVPTTVMNALSKNGVYPDIYKGNNIDTVSKKQFEGAWWYRTEFDIKPDQVNKTIQLVFEGINYRANIWLNGKQLSSTKEVVGAYRVFTFDVSNKIKVGKNALSVEVSQAKGGDFTVGFVDWAPTPPDNNMGIWRPVKLLISDAISLSKPFIQTKLDVSTLQKAALTISVQATNHSSKEVETTVKAQIEKINVSQKVKLLPGESKEIIFTPEAFPVLTLTNPRVWWPHDLGTPELYTASITASTTTTLSDKKEIRFGIRDVADYLNAQGHRGYKINGKEVLIKGGGWVDDLLLGDDKTSYETQLAYTKLMNLNTVRVEGFWGNSDLLYTLCDEMGLLVMAGWSCQWEWEEYLGKKFLPNAQFGGIETAEEMDLVAKMFEDQVLWLRNHPSIFVWTVGSDFLPNPELEKKYLAMLSQKDASRCYLGSCKSHKSAVTGPSAVKMEGPYDYVPPVYWYTDTLRGGAFGFNTETGPGPQPPVAESMKEMLPNTHWWPIDTVMWNFHSGRHAFQDMSRYMKPFVKRYGQCSGLDDFAFKAQIQNYELMRPMFEAFAVNRPKSTGVVQWMLNSAWPETFWQLYDWYLRPTGAFYGAMKGAHPLHLVYNYGDKSVYLVNQHIKSHSKLKANVRVYDSYSKEILNQVKEVNVSANAQIKVSDFISHNDLNKMYFISLRLSDSTGAMLHDNFYWVSTVEDVMDPEYKNSSWIYTPTIKEGDFNFINRLPKTKVMSSTKVTPGPKETTVTVTLMNTTPQIAFFIEMTVQGEKSNKSVYPVMWTDNYVSLLPGESRTYTVVVPNTSLKGETPKVVIKGMNIY